VSGGHLRLDGLHSDKSVSAEVLHDRIDFPRNPGDQEGKAAS
jgi:hypothetical protein